MFGKKKPKDAPAPSNGAEEKDKPTSSDKKMEKPDPVLQVMRRNKDLEKRVQKSLSTSLVLVGALVVSLGTNVILGTRKPPEPRYIVQQNDGTLVPVIPLSKPVANKNAVSQHVSDAISAMHAIDFKNFRSQLMDASVYFTRTGWKRYEDELQASGTREAIEKRQLVLSSVVLRPPTIVREYDINGVYAWDVEVPYQVQYQGPGFNQTQNLTARVTVVRIPTTENPKGIGIAGFNAVRGAVINN